MKVSPAQRQKIKSMFGGRCAYCGCNLDNRWHVDHLLPINRQTEYVTDANGHYETTKAGFTKTRFTGQMRNPENDVPHNLVPACVKCNILKGCSGLEEFRSTLTYFAHSIPRIQSYSHVHHLMRFGRLTISTEPVVFWFEQFAGVQAS